MCIAALYINKAVSSQVKYNKNLLLLGSYIFVPIIPKDHLYFGYPQNISV